MYASQEHAAKPQTCGTYGAYISTCEQCGGAVTTQTMGRSGVLRLCVRDRCCTGLAWATSAYPY